MFGTGIKTVVGRLFESQRQPPICTYLCTYNFLEACSLRNHVSHSWRSKASIGFSCGKPSIYVLRSSVLSICQQPGVFSLPLFPSYLAPSSSCSSLTFGVFLLFHSFVHPSIFSLYHFFLSFIHFLQFLFFYLITYLFDLFSVDLFSSHRSYFRVRFLPSPLVTPSFGRFTPLFVSLILLFLSAFDLYPSFAFRRLSSILSFFGFYQRGIGVLVSTS